MKVLFKCILFVVFLEIFLRIGGLISLSVQNYQNQSNLKNKNAYRIMCIGESTTFDGGKDSYPSQLERILNEQKGSRVFEVINRGTPGSNSAEIVANLKKDLELYKPDMVIAMVGINDTIHTIAYQDKWTDRIKVYIGDIRVIRVFKFVLADVRQKMMDWTGAKDNTKLSTEERLKREAKRHPKEEGVYSELGQYLCEKKKYKEAEDILKGAIKINPQKNWGYEQLAQIYVSQEHAYEAEKLFAQSLKQNPQRAWAYSSLSRFYISQHREQDAERVLKEGIGKNPNNLEIYGELAQFYHHKGQRMDEQKVLQRVIAMDSKKAGSYEQLGFCYGEQKRYSDMEDMFEKAAKLDGPHVFLNLSNWYMKQNESDRAEAMLKKVLPLYPDYASLMRGLANVYAQKGMKEKAEEYQRKAQEAGDQNLLDSTTQNYRKIVEIVRSKGISILCVSYAMRDIAPLRKMLKGLEGVIFVDNGKVFKDALTNEKYDDFFTDEFAGDFGHCTPRGAHLLAENIAKEVLDVVKSH